MNELFTNVQVREHALRPLVIHPLDLIHQKEKITPEITAKMVSACKQVLWYSQAVLKLKMIKSSVVFFQTNSVENHGRVAFTTPARMHRNCTVLKVTPTKTAFSLRIFDALKHLNDISFYITPC